MSEQQQPSYPDQGYTVEWCKSAIASCEALRITTNASSSVHLEKMLEWWKTQLEYAEKRAC